MSRPHLGAVIALAAVGAAMLLIAPTAVRASVWPAAAIGGVGLVLFAGAAYLLILRERYEQMERAEAQARVDEEASHENQVLDRLARVEPHQTELITQQIVRMTLMANPRHPITSIELTGLLPPVSVPLAFAQRVMRDSDSVDFAPQRLYSGQQRQWHQAILDWSKFHGAIDADPAGNQPAKWRPGGYDTICAAFSLADGDDDERSAE